MKILKKLTVVITLGLGIIGVSTPILAEPQWQPMTAEEINQNWQFILNSPLGIAALNQLAIEGFISPVCPKTWYQDETGFRSLLKVECPTPRGISSAVSYQEMKVTFNRFEDNIENFTVERVLLER